MGYVADGAADRERVRQRWVTDGAAERMYR